ncbi:MAG: hypothetical protein U1E65_06930 [Myxococcota bacterium]
MSSSQQPADSWTIGAAEIDESSFRGGRVGPFSLGPSVRRTAFGEVIIGLHRENRDIVEIDLYDALLGTPFASPESPLMSDLARVSALRHKNIAPIIGAGFDEGVPYVVRPHRLGKTLAELVNQGPIPGELAAVVLYAVSEGLDFLSEEGEGAAMGGLDARDVFLGYDGSVSLVGIGLRRVRGHEGDPRALDLQAAFSMARHLSRWSDAQLPAVIAGVSSFRELSRALRRRFASACAAGPRHVGSALRRAFPQVIREERAFFGLEPLQ